MQYCSSSRPLNTNMSITCTKPKIRPSIPIQSFHPKTPKNQRNLVFLSLAITCQQNASHVTIFAKNCQRKKTQQNWNSTNLEEFCSHLRVSVVVVLPKLQRDFRSKIRECDDVVEVVPVHDRRQRPARLPKEIRRALLRFRQGTRPGARLRHPQVLNQPRRSHRNTN
jgi:hypothetical protein